MCIQLKFTLLLFSGMLLLFPEVNSKHRHKSYHSHDLIISVHHSIPQDKELIRHLQEILTEASKLFHEVTDSLILSKTIKIVVPHSWTTYPVSGYSNNVEDLSDIHIENYHLDDEKREAIHTIQPGGCEQHGSYITMTPQFLHQKASRGNSTVKLVQHMLQYMFGIYEHLNLTSKSLEHHNVGKVQEDVCHGMSGWQVIQKELEMIKHQKKANRLFKLDAEYKAPQFEILQTLHENAYMFLVDMSLDFWNKTTFLPTMLDFFDDFIIHGLPLGTTFGYALYSDQAKVEQNLTELSVDTNYRNLSEKVQAHLKGSEKNLYAGFEACLQEFLARKQPTLGGRIILVTDIGWRIQQTGSHNYKEKLAQLLVTNGLILHSFVLSDHHKHQQHHKTLEELSHHTGGKYFILQDEEQLLKYGMEMLTTLVPENIMIISEELSSFPVKKEVHIESHMEGISKIYIEQDDLSPLRNIEVTSPKGELIGTLYNNQKYGKRQSIFQVRQKGVWTIHVQEGNETSDQNLHLRVISRPGPEASPVRLSAWIKEQYDHINDYTSMQVFAQIQYVNKLHHLHIMAEILTPSGNITHLKLKDSGLGADIVHGDGIYSAYFIHFHGKGRYEIAVRVSGKQKEKKIGSEVEEFHRYVFAGSFWINHGNKIDKIPPAPIRDLLVTNFTLSKGTNTISVKWTAVGDDMDHGKVGAYDLRITDSHKESDFEKWKHIFSDHITEGSLEPLPSGQEQKVTFQFPLEFINEHKTCLYLAMRSYDHHYNPSQLSNKASIHLHPKNGPTQQQNTTAPRSTTTHSETAETSTKMEEKTTTVIQKEPATSPTKTITSTNRFSTNNTESSFPNFLKNLLLHSTSPTTVDTSTETPKGQESTAIFNWWYGYNDSLTDNANNVSLRHSDSAEQNEKVRFAYVNIRSSTIVASFVAGICSMFFVMVIVAACVKNRKKKLSTYNPRKSEEDFVESMALKDEAI